MPPDIQERRAGTRLAGVIDDALELADECGWRYAILYMVHQKVPGATIQRLLSGEGKVRRAPKRLTESAPALDGAPVADMKDLFDWLQQRRSSLAKSDAHCAARESASAEID